MRQLALSTRLTCYIYELFPSYAHISSPVFILTLFPVIVYFAKFTLVQHLTQSSASLFRGLLRLPWSFCSPCRVFQAHFALALSIYRMLPSRRLPEKINCFSLWTFLWVWNKHRIEFNNIHIWLTILSEVECCLRDYPIDKKHPDVNCAIYSQHFSQSERRKRASQNRHEDNDLGVNGHFNYRFGYWF